MRILFLGGTGNISAAASRLLVRQGHELYLLTRGRREGSIPGARMLKADVSDLSELLHQFGHIDGAAAIGPGRGGRRVCRP